MPIVPVGHAMQRGAALIVPVDISAASVRITKVWSRVSTRLDCGAPCDRVFRVEKSGCWPGAISLKRERERKSRGRCLNNGERTEVTSAGSRAFFGRYFGSVDLSLLCSSFVTARVSQFRIHIYVYNTLSFSFFSPFFYVMSDDVSTRSAVWSSTLRRSLDREFTFISFECVAYISFYEVPRNCRQRIYIYDIRSIDEIHLKIISVDLKMRSIQLGNISNLLSHINWQRLTER